MRAALVVGPDAAPPRPDAAETPAAAGLAPDALLQAAARAVIPEVEAPAP